MARKIKLDFSKVEERSGWNTKHIPAGLHKAKIISVKVTEAKDGIDMLVYAFQPTAPEYKTRVFPYYCKLQQNQLWKLRDLLVASGQKVPKKATSIDPEKIVGSIIAIEVKDDQYKETVRSQVDSVYSVNILDEEDEAPEPEADEEDFDEFDEEEEDTLPEDKEEEEEEDLDDFDDFDEDDLDDLDDLDEEEEEEEKPKKKATKKTSSKKAPAKKSKK